MGTFDLKNITEEDCATLAANGDAEALAYLWELVVPRVRRIVAKQVKRHTFLRRSAADIQQGVLLKFPVFIKRWDHRKAKSSFDKWLYFTIRFASQDVIRAQKDSLGIKIPQKKAYPKWWYMSDYKTNGANIGSRKSDDGELDGMIIAGLDRIDRGYELDLPSENKG